ncbi:uncharacterized protein TM35_000062160 [Trypanosoma theileri]|uniref:Uncharacterized protein n=1 Tax=Trypanosoma theileri TaxID=67003 RepID=A0A1X0P2X9_9TRYP|nr:uncharacterized protein TM35_000062160 [Trypanosoma theileri]ORC91211.1 hypothetical protein TM35_000062160 [Trypanosoma theileri]
MKKRQTPHPTGISSYFFQQLVQPTDTHTDTSTTTEDNNKKKNKIDKEIENVLSQDELNRRTAVILKDAFTSVEAKKLLHRSAEEEHHRSDTLEEFLKVSWERVEEIIERNKARRQIFENELPHALTPMNTYIYWTPDTVATRYKFPGPNEFGFRSRVPANITYTDTNDMEKKETTPTPPLGDEDSHTNPAQMDSTQTFPSIPIQNNITTTNNNASSNNSNNTNTNTIADTTSVTSGAATAPGKHRAKAWTMTNRDLLDPSKSPHCLRRLFAPILRQREQLPKSLTLLLNAVQRLQTERFPEIEAIIEKGFFDMPVHRSFRSISSFVSRYLTEAAKGETEEREFSKEYKAEAKKLTDAYEKLRQLEAKKTTSSSRDSAAEVVYSTLLTELRERKELHERCNEEMKSITEAASAELKELDRVLQECDNDSRKTLSDLEENAKKYMSGLNEACEHIKASKEEIHHIYQREHKLLQDSIDSKLYRAKKSEEQQEKIARRIRELAKEWYSEQVKYENLVQEIIEERVSLRQLDLSHNQLVTELEARVSSAGFEMLDWVSDALRQSEECRARLITECRQHIGRLKTEDHYRRCRVAGYMSENALYWSRCLQDLAVLCESHYDLLSEKCNASLQMRYLLAYEKDQVVKDLQYIQQEIRNLDTKWAALVPLLEELEMPVPPLAQYEQDPNCLELRRLLCELDSHRLIRGVNVRIAPVSEEAPASTPADTIQPAASDSNE